MSVQDPAQDRTAVRGTVSSRSDEPQTRDMRWIALAVLGISQLMIVLDATIVNTALTAIETDLDFSTSNLQWVVNAYTLAFGGFLLLGGRLADKLGRRRLFMVGAALFAVSSLVGGFAVNQGMLIGARAVQGLGGAIMAPAALSLLTVVFAEGKDRDRALGLWAAISAGGAALGLILGGVLTQQLSWEWVLWVNVPIAAGAVVAARLLLPESKDETARTFDVTGAVFGTAGLVVLVFGLVRANDEGWGSFATIGSLALAVVLLAVFIQIQRTKTDSLVPTEVLKRKSVLGADIGSLLIGAAVFAIFFFLALFFGGVLGYGPIKIGLAFLPMTITIAVSAGISSVLLGRVGPRPLLVTGSLIAASGLALLSTIAPDSSYVMKILPALLLVALGIGTSFVALTSAAVAGVPEEDSGIASALLNAGQQVGGALGLAILTAVSSARTNALFSGNPSDDPAYVKALTDGWGAGFLVAAGIMLIATAVFATLVKVNKEEAVAAMKNASAGA